MLRSFCADGRRGRDLCEKFIAQWPERTAMGEYAKYGF